MNFFKKLRKDLKDTVNGPPAINAEQFASPPLKEEDYWNKEEKAREKVEQQKEEDSVNFEIAEETVPMFDVEEEYHKEDRELLKVIHYKGEKYLLCTDIIYTREALLKGETQLSTLKGKVYYHCKKGSGKDSFNILPPEADNVLRSNGLNSSEYNTNKGIRLVSLQLAIELDFRFPTSEAYRSKFNNVVEGIERVKHINTEEGSEERKIEGLPYIYDNQDDIYWVPLKVVVPETVKKYSTIYERVKGDYNKTTRKMNIYSIGVKGVYENGFLSDNFLDFYYNHKKGKGNDYVLFVNLQSLYRVIKEGEWKKESDGWKLLSNISPCKSNKESAEEYESLETDEVPEPTPIQELDSFKTYHRVEDTEQEKETPKQKPEIKSAEELVNSLYKPVEGALGEQVDQKLEQMNNIRKLLEEAEEVVDRHEKALEDALRLLK